MIMLTTYVEPFSPEHTSVSGMEKCIFTPTHTEPAVRRQPRDGGEDTSLPTKSPLQ